ncbi:MAG: C-GCAxxG-C-C family (seleno)protein [Bacilli bacterium]
MSENHDLVSRRGFLSGAGLMLAGAAAGMAGHGLFVEPATAAIQESPSWPWPYAPLDEEMVRKKGHQGYYINSCSQGSFYAIITELREKVGAPYTYIPVELMAYGASGVAGWCTLCGALNGSCAAISLTCKDYDKLTGELLAWFTQTPFPSDISNQYAKDHAFLVDKYKSDKVLPQTVSGSPLCHVNVSKWCKEHGFASGSHERSERCARISGDVAAMAVHLLNAYHAGTFTPKYDLSQTTKTCRACHQKGKDFEKGNWTRGKMDCGGCHIEGQVSLVSPTHPK